MMNSLKDIVVVNDNELNIGQCVIQEDHWLRWLCHTLYHTMFTGVAS